MINTVCVRCGYVGPVGLDGEWISHPPTECLPRRQRKPDVIDVDAIMNMGEAAASYLRVLHDNELRQLEAVAVVRKMDKLIGKVRDEIIARDRALKMREYGVLYCPYHSCHKDRCPPHDDE